MQRVYVALLTHGLHNLNTKQTQTFISHEPSRVTTVHLRQSIYLWTFVCVYTFVKKRSYRGVWREERPGDSVEVSERELDTGVGEAQLVYVVGGVSGTDVALS